MTHARKPFLMGAETELAASGLRDGQPMDPEEVYDLLAEALRRLRATVPDQHGYQGLYLENGARLYLDYGSHPEHATPECLTPRQVAAYDKAGEHLLALARDAAVAENANLRICLIKNNLDPVEPDENTYGTHESYTLWGSAEYACPQLLPHLASRVLFAGAGGLSGEGVGFELSQRARHIEYPSGDDTTDSRPIFGTRLRKQSDAGDEWVRVHLICKDSQRAPFGTYLTFAATGLLIEMLNRGHKVGQGLALADPVRALKAFSRDPFARVKVPLADGRSLSALEIQSAYVEQAERAVLAGGLPDWAGEAVAHWRQTLADLERDPRRLADRLDPYCKLVIVEHELLRAGHDWDDLRLAVRQLNGLRSSYGEQVTRAILSDSGEGLAGEDAHRFAQARLMTDVPLETLLFATRLQALDLNYHELGGLYDRLRDAGRMRDVVLAQADVEEASRVPPPGGRAAVRGAGIRAAGGEEGWRGDWQYLWHPQTGRCLDLRDPFDGREKAVTLKVPEKAAPWSVQVLDLLEAQGAEPA
jgi:hypothetical protein